MPGKDGRFRPGEKPWNAGLAGAGICKPNRGTFGGPLNPGGHRAVKPVGVLGFRNASNDVVVKVSMTAKYASQSPTSGTWKPQRVVNFEAVHGPVPRGAGRIEA